MFRNQSSTKKSMNCGASTGIAPKIAIPALASRVITMLSTLIGGIGAVFYMIFFSILKQAKQHLCSSVTQTESTNINNINSDSYILRLEESAQFSINSDVPVEHKIFGIQNKNQIKFVKKELFFCAMLSDDGKTTPQKPNKCKNVEQKKDIEQKTENNSSMIKNNHRFLESLQNTIERFNNLMIIDPAFREILKAI